MIAVLDKPPLKTRTNPFRQLRRQLDLTIEGMADYSGLSEAAIANIEHGRPVQPETLKRYIAGCIRADDELPEKDRIFTKGLEETLRQSASISVPLGKKQAYMGKGPVFGSGSGVFLGATLPPGKIRESGTPNKIWQR